MEIFSGAFNTYGCGRYFGFIVLCGDAFGVQMKGGNLFTNRFEVTNDSVRDGRSTVKKRMDLKKPANVFDVRGREMVDKDRGLVLIQIRRDGSTDGGNRYVGCNTVTDDDEVTVPTGDSCVVEC